MTVFGLPRDTEAQGGTRSTGGGGGVVKETSKHAVLRAAASTDLAVDVTILPLSLKDSDVNQIRTVS